MPHGGGVGGGVGSGIAGTSQSGIGAAPGTGVGVTGGGGQNIGGVSHNYASRFGAPRRGSDIMAQLFSQQPTITPTHLRRDAPPMPMAKPTRNVGPSSDIGALVAMGVDPGLAAALAGKPIGQNFGGVSSPAPGTAVQGTKGDRGGPTIGGPPGTASGGQDHRGATGGLPAPGTASGGKGDFGGFRGSMHGMNSPTNSVGVRGVGPKGDFGSGFPGRRGDFGGATRGISGAQGSDLPGAQSADALAAQTGGTFPGSDQALDSVFSGLRQARDFFAGQQARRGFQNSRVGGVGGSGGVPPQGPGANFQRFERGR